MTFYKFARLVVLGLCSLAFRVRVTGVENVPPSGAYIVAPSHRSIFDVPFSAYITNRSVRFLAKEELFRKPALNWLFTKLGAVQVERGTADRGALRVLETALREGTPVALFPEGTRASGPEIAPLFDGAAYLAVKLGVPIVPVGVGGSEQILAKGKVLPRLHRVAVVVGKPIPPPPVEGRSRRTATTTMTAELTAELQRVFTEARRVADETTS
jgi:1-acyl-sn-glycerol-3-phosphate acyltransferase